MMAKMRTSRASLSKAALQVCYGGAQTLDLGREAGELATRYQGVALHSGVIGERLCHALHGVHLPARKPSQRAADALGGDVAHDARELFLEVPAQVFLQETQLISECALPCHAL